MHIPFVSRELKATYCVAKSENFRENTYLLSADGYVEPIVRSFKTTSPQ